MSENLGKTPSEAISLPLVRVYRESEQGEQMPLLGIDGQKVNQVLAHIDYPASFPDSIYLAGQKSQLGGADIADYDARENRVGIYEKILIEELKNMRQRDHGYIDGQKRPGKLQRFSEFAMLLLQPSTSQYALLENPIRLSGNPKRLQHYIDLVGSSEFTIKDENGQRTKPKSIEEARIYAKHVYDKLLETAVPNIVGWILAHELEHRIEHRRKQNIKKALTLVPLILGMTLSLKSGASVDEISTGIFGSIVSGYVGKIFGEYLDEKASYDAGNKYGREFAAAVTVDHKAFVERVLEQ